MKLTKSVSQSAFSIDSESENTENYPRFTPQTQLGKITCFMALISSLCIIAILTFTTNYLYQKSKESLLSSQGTCMTKGCKKTAAYILDSLNEKIDPCDDFYQFACGGWMDKHTIPDNMHLTSVWIEEQTKIFLKLKDLLEKPSSDSDPNYLKVIKDMYNSCMDLESIEKTGAEPLKKILETLGGWPAVVGEKWNSSDFDWIDTLLAFRKHGYSPNILLHTEVLPDRKNNSNNIILLDRQDFGFDVETLVKYYHRSLQVTGYLELMIKTAVKLGANEVKAKKELTKVLKFELIIANFTEHWGARAYYRKKYNKQPFKRLQAEIPQINWIKYFNGLLSYPITDDEPLLIEEPEYIRKLAIEIDRTDKRVIANYLIWRLILQSLPFLSDEWSKLKVITPPKVPRWQICIANQVLAAKSFGVASGALYVNNYFKKEIKDEVLQLVKWIRKEFLNVLDKNDWLDKETKAHAKDKAKAMRLIVGYPEELLNDTLVNESCENLTMTNNSYYYNTRNFFKSYYDGFFSEQRGFNVKTEWEQYSSAATVDAYNKMTRNTVYFLAGVLQSFVHFDIDRPKYMNFGAIGSLIGHEILHGYTAYGRQFDKDGSEINWWNETSVYRFAEKVVCLIYQYGNYTAGNGKQLNGYLTRDENIADNSGLKVAYLAYQSWVNESGTEPNLPGLKYTPNQLFWISAANMWCVKYTPEGLTKHISEDVHSPYNFRVIGPFSNRPEFSKDFQCPLGSRMNPHKKCEVW